MTQQAAFERILLIDDNEADNVYHEIVIRVAGFTGELLIHESGQAALAYLGGIDVLPPCLILLDINMPGMSGFEFARAAQPLLCLQPAVIVVMLTSSAAQEDRDRAESMPEINGYLTKPLTVEATRALLERPG